MKSNYVLLAMLITGSILFTACGGGGGGGGGPAPSPSPGGASFTVGGMVSGLASGTLVLQNNSSDNLTISTNGVFTFATAISDGASYSVTVLTQPSGLSCAVSNNTGTVSGADVTNVAVVCSASAGAWGSPELIEFDDTHSTGTEPQVAADTSGNAIAVWIQSDGTDNNVWTNRYTASVGWGTPELIEGTAGNATQPQIAMNAAGNAVVVWQQDDGTHDNIWANRYTVSSGWETATLLETNDSSNASTPQVGMDDTGNAIVTWGQGGIWVNQYTAGTGWGTATLIMNTVGSPRIAMSSSGNAIVVGRSGSNNELWASHYTPGSGWSTATSIETVGGGGATFHQLAIDKDGNGMLVWESYVGVEISIWAKYYTAGVGWGTSGAIENDAGTAYVPQVAFDSTGNAIAVWRWYFDDGTTFPKYNIWANRYVKGTGWGTATLVEPNDNNGDAYPPQLGMDADGNAIVVWNQSDGDSYIWANRYTAGVGWGTPEIIDKDKSTDHNPDVAVDHDGNAIAVWQQYDGSTFLHNIWADRFQ